MGFKSGVLFSQNKSQRLVLKLLQLCLGLMIQVIVIMKRELLPVSGYMLSGARFL